MTTFRAFMAQRRAYPRHTAEHEYMTRAARKALWLLRGVPVTQWENEQ
jgi:hypothetical protein